MHNNAIPPFGAFVKQSQNDFGYDGPTRIEPSAQERFGAAVERIIAAEAADKSARHGHYPAPKSASELANGSFPVPWYVWAGFILQGYVNLLYGDGGAGKTLLDLHIAVAVADGISLFERETRKMPVLIVLAEDDYGATKNRLQDICLMLGTVLSDLEIDIWCLPGSDASIAHIQDDGSWTPGPFMEPLQRQVASYGRPILLIFDTASDAATLDESKRLAVNTFCKQVAGGFCRDYGATVIINAHPSKAAMADGTGYSGSTAWNNAVRNRLTLERGEEKSERRILKVAKANYGGDAELELFLVGTTFMQSAAVGRTEADEKHAVLQVALELIDKNVLIVRNNGSGQSPEDIAAAVKSRFGLPISKKQARHHLATLEREGMLSYEASDKAKRILAGYRRGPRCPK